MEKAIIGGRFACTGHPKTARTKNDEEDWGNDAKVICGKATDLY
jgi:hypothetical protein